MIEEKNLIQSKSVCVEWLGIALLLFSALSFVYSLNWALGEMNDDFMPITFMQAFEYGYFTPFFAIGVPCILLNLLLYFGIYNCSITVTNKRVYGKAAFGKRVDLPIDSLSAVGINCLFKQVTVSTSSGKIAFFLISNNQSIHKVLCDLVISRQSNNIQDIGENATISNADEIKKFKELFDNGVISQEEFDAKKRQLLDG